MRFLLVDDDPDLLRTIERGLTELGHACRTSSDPERALAALLAEGTDDLDLILLDVMMPGLDGWQLLERLRAHGDRTPVIFVTARQEVEERVRGLELGADDYIVKPFALRELIARAEAVLRRHGYRAPLAVGPLVVHRDRPVIEVHGNSVEVSEREHAFLQLLAESPARVFSREELLRRLWSIEFDPGTNVVDVLVARLRKKLGPRNAHKIRTVVGEGYTFGGTTREEPEGTA